MKNETKKPREHTERWEELIPGLPREWYAELTALSPKEQRSLEEIRIRVGRPVLLRCGDQEKLLGCTRDQAVSSKTMEAICASILGYSAYAYQEELAEGYVTLSSGFRVGFCGRAVTEGESVKTLRDISSLNIRRARALVGISERCLPYLISDSGRFYNTLIISPPKCGKTTLLRDLVRSLSSRGFQMGVCDERNELSGSLYGGFAYDLGARTDVLSGCPKEKGMVMLLRSMAPDIIAADEIGRERDCAAMAAASAAGVGLLTTIHGETFDDVCRSGVGKMVEQGLFSRLIFLSGKPKVGTIAGIFGSDGRSVREQDGKRMIRTDRQNAGAV